MESEIKEKSHILIVDDDENLRLSLKMFLARDGYCKISDVSNYEEAIEIVSTQKIDLIISDIILKGTSGMDLLRWVKKMGIECPVVMITGYPSNETLSEAEQLGAFKYMPKPVKKDGFLSVTRNALQYHFNLTSEKPNKIFEEE
ncbi:response regulator [Thermodesulfobacteriota bacterium]